MRELRFPERPRTKCQKTTVENFYKKHCDKIGFRDDRNRTPTVIVKRFFEPEKEYLTALVQPGSRVIDVGCGDGRVLEYLQSKASSLTGVDYSLDQCRMAMEVLTSATIVVGSALSMPFNESSFDYVLCTFNTFGNFGENKANLLSEMARITVPGGTIVATVYSKAALRYQFELYRNFGFEVASFDDKRVVLREGLRSERFSTEEIKSVGREVGMTAEITPLSEIAYAFKITRG